MKKLTALVLTLTMLFSVFSALPVMAEENRETILNARNYTYLDIEFNRDMFVTFEELIDNARFSNTIDAVPTLDDDGNPLDPSVWYWRKGQITPGSADPTCSAKNLTALLID